MKMHGKSIGAKQYVLQRGSDVVRDGLFLELFADSLDGQVLAEVFFSDERHEMTFTAFVEDIPVAAVEWLIERSKLHLPPATRPSWYESAP